MSDHENDYTLLRPLDLAAVAHGAHVCDKRGRTLSIDGATELLEQNGPQALRLAPICWLEGKPVYPDSELEFRDYGSLTWGYRTTAGRYSPRGKLLPVAVANGSVRWPAKKVERNITVYLDGELVAHETTLTKPGAKFLGASFAFEG